VYFGVAPVKEPPHQGENRYTETEKRRTYHVGNTKEGMCQ
jgi:hypothetical protein